jgi:hypothetical protein
MSFQGRSWDTNALHKFVFPLNIWSNQIIHSLIGHFNLGTLYLDDNAGQQRRIQPRRQEYGHNDLGSYNYSKEKIISTEGCLSYKVITVLVLEANEAFDQQAILLLFA